MNTNPPEEHGNRRKRLLLWGGAAVVVVIALVGAFLWWFFRDDAPDEVSIDDAAAQVLSTDDTDGTEAPTTAEDVPDDTAAPDTAAADDAPGDADAAADAPTDGDAATIEGVWTIDTSVGEFSFEDSTGTFAGFRVEEELTAIGSTTAVGRTPEVSGTITIDGTTVTDVTVEADMTAIATNDSRRDSKVQDALETGDHPLATFRTTQPIELDEGASSGEVVAVTAPGELTIHGVTTAVEMPLEAQLVGDTIVVVGSLEIVFADYGVSVPSAPIVLSASDDGELELQLFFTR